MYKLLTTAAVIMTVATPSFAWTGTKDLIKDLNTIYGGVDGGTHFNALIDNSGALGTFVNTVNQGVTHITLEVDPANNNISVGVNDGVTFQEIKDAQTNLVSQVNYDLFVDEDLGTIESFTGYTGGIVIENPGGNGINGNLGDADIDNGGKQTYLGTENADGSIDYSTSLTTGLVGAKVNKVVTDVTEVNDYLVNGDTDTTEAGYIITNIGSDTDLNTVDGLDGLTFNTDITGLNASINAANNAGFDFFGNINDQSGVNAVTGSTINNFQVNGYDGTSVNDGTTTYPSLLDWANGTNGVDN